MLGELLGTHKFLVKMVTFFILIKKNNFFAGHFLVFIHMHTRLNYSR